MHVLTAWGRAGGGNNSGGQDLRVRVSPGGDFKIETGTPPGDTVRGSLPGSEAKRRGGVKKGTRCRPGGGKQRLDSPRSERRTRKKQKERDCLLDRGRNGSCAGRYFWKGTLW